MSKITRKTSAVKAPLPLCKQDLADLRASGLSDATIRANGLYTEESHEEIGKLLNRYWSDSQGGGLAIPYHDSNGQSNGFVRVKPHQPLKNDKGKIRKYEQPWNTKLRAYQPVECIEQLHDNQSDIIVVEGEKKALALAQLGYTVIALGGVDCWGKAGVLIDDLAEIVWESRTVYICFDWDEKQTTRWQVAGAKRRLAKALTKEGANIHSIDLPPGPGDTKQGVDDFLVAHGDEKFAELVENAQPVRTTVSLAETQGRTDASNALRLIDKHGHNLRFCGPWKKWLYYDGIRWPVDDSFRVQAYAKEIGAELWKDVAAAAGKIDSEVVKKMVGFATKTNNEKGVTGMVALARSDSDVVITPDQLDQHPMLFNVKNGTVELTTGKLREHRKSDLLTKMAPVTFNRQAKCPRWRKFLKEIFSNDEKLIGFVQRLIGYCLTGDTSEHMLPILHGDGANGKSTLVGVVLKLLGKDFGMKGGQEFLMKQRGERHPTEVMDLHGKRLAVCMETGDGRALNESRIKELTGGDTIHGRRMREDAWEFEPTHKLWLASNYKPVIVGQDYGIWRRVKLVPFNVRFADKQQDKKLLAKLENELPGILNWALTGCLDWQKNGMQEPEIVQTATKNYSDEMDEVGDFISQCCELGDGFVAPATLLYQAFQTAMPDSEMSQQSFGTNLRRRGHERKRITSGPHKAKHAWKGLRLHDTG